MNNVEKGLTITVFGLLGVVMVMSMWLAFSNIARDEAKAKAEAMESLYNLTYDKYADTAEDLARCRANVKVVTETRTIIKKVPGSWWTSPQDTVRDTIYTVPDSVRTWLWTN